MHIGRRGSSFPRIIKIGSYIIDIHYCGLMKALCVKVARLPKFTRFDPCSQKTTEHL